MMDALITALSETTELRIESGDWHLGEFIAPQDEIDAAWGALDPTRVAVEKVIFFDDGHYEAPTFLSAFGQLEELVLYGNTLIHDLSMLAHHPRLQRVALTNYCGLTTAEQLAFLSTLPHLNELILLDGYLELPAPALPAEVTTRLRSLWLSWAGFAGLTPAPLKQLERLTIELTDVDAFTRGVNDLEARLRALLTPLGDRGGRVRVFHRHRADAADRAQLEASFARCLPDGATTTHHWRGQPPEPMQVLSHGDAFLGERPLLSAP
ncbi:MAG: hypothetical protein CMH57_01905 [Myxococcales bacterium]|nr:hypothetical protein [Myxococcales bacterium]